MTSEALGALPHRLRLWADVAPFSEMREAMIEEAEHIEAAEQRLREAGQLITELLAITEMRGGKGPLVDEARAFLRSASEDDR